MPKVFICYRREDSDYPAHRIYEELTNHFGSESVVFDVDTFPMGNFREYLNEQVNKCDILLAVIGNRWLEILGQRLNDPKDFVRIEIQAALDRKIPVVPVLVAKASMPNEENLPPELAELAMMNAAEMRAGADLQTHLKRLIGGLDHLLAEQEAARKAEEERRKAEAETKRRAEEEQLRPERQQQSGISSYKALGFIPVLLMLTYASPIINGFNFYFLLAFVPLAVFLGHRYGSAGLITVALGGALLPLGFAGAFGLFGGQLAIYILSLWLCAIFASGKDIKEVLSKSDIFQNPSVITGVLFASLIFLPIVFRYSADVGFGLVTRFHFSGMYILYFVLWYLGTQNVNRRMVIVFLFCFAFFGFLLRHFKFIPIFYSLNAPGDVLVGAFFFIAGEYTRKLLDNQAGIQEVPRLVKGIIVACMVLYGAAFIDRLIENIVGIPYLYLTGGPSYLVVMSFLLGTYYGRRGIIFSGVCIFVFETVVGVIRVADPDIARMTFGYGGNLGMWITGVAYAWLGKGFVDRIRIESRQATTSTQGRRDPA